jgi:hypothetical protein
MTEQERPKTEIDGQVVEVTPTVGAVLAIPQGLNFQELFQFLGRREPYRQVITRVRNPDVLNDRAWLDVQGVLSQLIPGYQVDRKYSLPVIKDLFEAYRTAFVDNEKDNTKSKKEAIAENLRRNKRRILGGIDSEEEFAIHAGIANTVFEHGLFQGVPTEAPRQH